MTVPPPDPSRRNVPASPAVPHRTKDRVGATIGKCKLLRLLGRGGNGEVYLAEHTVLQKQVAVKILLAHRLSSEDGVARFQREAAATARLENPHGIQVHDA